MTPALVVHGGKGDMGEVRHCLVLPGHGGLHARDDVAEGVEVLGLGVDGVLYLRDELVNGRPVVVEGGGLEDYPSRAHWGGRGCSRG